MSKYRVKLALLVLVLAMLTGCAGAENGQENARQTQESSQAAEAMGTEESSQAVIGTEESSQAAEVMGTEGRPTVAEPGDEEFVRVLDWIPGICQELRYSGADNFTGQKIYDFQEAYLRYGTVKKLKTAQDQLEAWGMGLKIWDAFRPVSAQYTLWRICPNPTYVANPETGFSAHSRGNTVDVTLVDREGQELEMPTAFDDFSARADRDYSDCTDIQKANALTLEAVMEHSGFSGYFGEWWHFTDTEGCEVEEDFAPPQ